ncbi:hypothetical protein Bbelb_193960 [Branchiostoma belcheri]|nr:hypothetical protein Bbelb_193960 [Branchiostoma belcheri]
MEGISLGSALWKVRGRALWKVHPLAARCGRSAEERYGRYIIGSALWKVRGRALWKVYPWQRAVEGPRKSAMEGISLGSALWKVRGRALWKVYPWHCAVEGPRKSAMEGISLAARCGRSAEERYGRYILGSALWKVRGRALWKVYPLAARCGRSAEERYGRYIPWQRAVEEVCGSVVVGLHFLIWSCPYDGHSRTSLLWKPGSSGTFPETGVQKNVFTSLTSVLWQSCAVTPPSACVNPLSVLSGTH